MKTFLPLVPLILMWCAIIPFTTTQEPYTFTTTATTTTSTTATTTTTSTTSTTSITPTTSTTKTTTTTSAPFTPVSFCVNNGIVGRFPVPHASKCQQYVYCYVLASGSLTGALYVCAGSTVFNPKLQQCTTTYVCTN